MNFGVSTLWASIPHGQTMAAIICSGSVPVRAISFEPVEVISRGRPTKHCRLIGIHNPYTHKKEAGCSDGRHGTPSPGAATTPRVRHDAFQIQGRWDSVQAMKRNNCPRTNPSTIHGHCRPY